MYWEGKSCQLGGCDKLAHGLSPSFVRLCAEHYWEYKQIMRKNSGVYE